MLIRLLAAAIFFSMFANAGRVGNKWYYYLTVQFKVGPDEVAECEGLNISISLSDGSTHQVVMVF